MLSPHSAGSHVADRQLKLIAINFFLLMLVLFHLLFLVGNLLLPEVAEVNVVLALDFVGIPVFQEVVFY